MPDFRVSGYFEGEHDCEPPEPDKRWWAVVDEDENEYAVFVQRKRDGVFREDDASDVYERAVTTKNALNEFFGKDGPDVPTDTLRPADTVTFNLTRNDGKTITVDLRDGSCEEADEDDLTLSDIDLFRAGEYVTSYNSDQLIDDDDDWDVISRAAEIAGVFVPGISRRPS